MKWIEAGIKPPDDYNYFVRCEHNGKKYNSISEEEDWSSVDEYLDESQPLKEEFDVNKQANIISLASGMFRSEPQKEKVNEDELWNEVLDECDMIEWREDKLKYLNKNYSITRK